MGEALLFIGASSFIFSRSALLLVFSLAPLLFFSLELSVLNIRLLGLAVGLLAKRILRACSMLFLM